MKIAILNNCVPFITGGAELLAEALAGQLQAHGHQAAVYRIPFRWAPAEKIVESMAACRLIRLVEVDRVIALKFPVYYVPHDNKVLWLLHQFRQAYELWGTPWQDLPDTPDGRRIRQAIVQADNTCLPEARAIYTNSHVTGNRLRKFNQLESEVLYPPLLSPEQYRCDEYGDYVFYPSRITRAKRQELAVTAMRYTRTPVRLVIAGQPESADELRRLEGLIRAEGVAGKVQLLPRFISEDDKAKWFAGALATIYTPVDEDSYGYVTLESYQSRKPVISCRDSGGVSIVVKHGETGYLAPPGPREIAQVLDELYLNKARARAMGEAGFELVQSLGITWERVVRKLTA